MTDQKNSRARFEPLERITFVAVVVASGISLIFSLAGYPAVGHDANVHLNWLDQFARLCPSQTLYPRWLPISNAGFGSPTFYFYPPLPYWVASFLRLFLPFVPSPFYNLMALIPTIGSCAAMFFLVRRYSSRPLPIAIAVLTYSFLGYHFADVFVRDALGEQWALMFLPLLFIEPGSRIRHIVLHALAWTGLLLTNIPVVLLAACAMFVILLVKRQRKIVIEEVLAGMIAAAVCAVYLLPAIELRDLIHTSHLWDRIIPTTGFAVLDLFESRGWLRFLASATLIAGLLYVIFQRSRRDAWWWIALVAVALQIPIFAPLWHWHGASLIQFSWRWNSIVLLGIAVAAVRGRSRIVLLAISGLAIVTIVGEFRLSNEFWLNRPIPINAYRMDAPEYQPIWTDSNPYAVWSYARWHFDDPPATLLGLTNPGDTLRLLDRTSASMKFQSHLTRATGVRFHLFYWPYWSARADTSNLRVFPDPNGIATAFLPAGNYILTLKLTESPIEKTGTWISMIGACLLAVIVALTSYRWMANRRDTTSPPELTRKI